MDFSRTEYPGLLVRPVYRIPQPPVHQTNSVAPDFTATRTGSKHPQ